jgi:hypothetical protein
VNANPDNGSQRYYLASIQLTLSAADLRQDPVLCRLAAEDACWIVTCDAWRRRKPMPWQRRKMQAWARDRETLWSELSNLRALAQLCGLTV